MRGLIELFVVMAFALGWGVLELFALRLDRRKRSLESPDSTDRSKSA